MEVRVDKYLFAMRIYKTRSIATDACKCGRVKMNGAPHSPPSSRERALLPVVATHDVLRALRRRSPS